MSISYSDSPYNGLTYERSRDLALDYVSMNPTRYLFPIKAGSKFPPLIKNNLADASNDPVQLEAWAKKWPGCNWGVAHRKSNLLVVDIDQKPGKEGERTFDDLDLEYGFPETEENRTPSGGRHLVYEGPHVFALGENGFGKDIDSPNYTMIAGCQFTDGTAYTSVKAIAAAPAPAWFYEVLGRAKERLVDAGVAVVELDKPENIAWAIDNLKVDAEPAIEGKSGDLQTVKIAMGLRDRGISPQLATELMIEHYNPRCVPPWEPDDLRKKVENAYNYANQSQVGGKTAEAEFAGDEFDPARIQTGDPKKIAEQREERQRRADGLPELQDDDRRPIVVHDAAHLPEITRKVQELVVRSAQANDAKPADQIFQRGGSLVHLSRNRLLRGEEIDRTYHVNNDLMILPVKDDWLADRLERELKFVRVGKKAGDSGKSLPKQIPIPAPRDVVRRLSAIKQDWKYPLLNGTVETPSLRRDGTVLGCPGYDDRSGLYFDPGLINFPPIKDRPTKADALAALEVLKKPLADFPFGDEDGITGLSRSVALSMLLTAVCRRALPTAPMFGIDANEAQSGKTELAQVAAIVMTGRRTAARPLSSDEYQRSTALAAAFEAGDPVILYDNIDGDKMTVEGEALCMALTEEQFQMRRLGGNSASDQIIAPTNALIVATGNKLTAAGDMSEDRILICNLRADRPLAERKYKHWPLDEFVMTERPALVSAALTILRAHVVAIDRKPGAPFRMSEWRSVVADALVWLGEPDPVLGAQRAKAEDPIRDAQRDVVRAYVRCLDRGEHTTSGVLAHPEIEEAIADARGIPSNKLTKKAAANFLKGMVGIDLHGYKLTRWKDPHDKMDRWKVEAGRNAVEIRPKYRRASEDDLADLLGPEPIRR